jgi:hypothetical protein
MIEKALILSCQGVYKLSQPTGHSRGVSINKNMDDNSDNELIPIPFALQKVSKWALLMFGTSGNIHRFNLDNIASHINKDRLSIVCSCPTTAVTLLVMETNEK